MRSSNNVNEHPEPLAEPCNRGMLRVRVRFEARNRVAIFGVFPDCDLRICSLRACGACLAALLPRGDPLPALARRDSLVRSTDQQEGWGRHLINDADRARSTESLHLGGREGPRRARIRGEALCPDPGRTGFEGLGLSGKPG